MDVYKTRLDQALALKPGESLVYYSATALTGGPVKMLATAKQYDKDLRELADTLLRMALRERSVHLVQRRSIHPKNHSVTIDYIVIAKRPTQGRKIICSAHGKKLYSVKVPSSTSN